VGCENKIMSETKSYQGGCHCGAVRFEAKIDLTDKAGRCNCTMCAKTGRAGLVMKPAAFQLLAGEGNLTDYSRGPHSHFLFCKTCGVHVFGKGHIPEMGGDYVSVNVLTLDEVDPATLTYQHWDGRHDNWQAGPRDTPWPFVKA
jgi:hypothetical protein